MSVLAAARPAAVARPHLAARLLPGALVIIVFAVALAARLVAAGGVWRDPSAALVPDSPTYTMLAASLRRGDGFAGTIRPPFTPAPIPDALERTPTYPAFLAAVEAVAGDDPRAIVAAQAVVGALTAAAVVALVLALGLGEAAATGAGLVIATDPATLDAGNLVLTETVATALAVAGLLALALAWRRRAWPWLGAAGLAFGLAGLARPIGVALPLALAPVFPLALGRRRAALGALAIFLAGGLVLPAAWTLRNGVAYGEWTVSTIATYNLAEYVAAPVEAEVRGISWDAARADLAGASVARSVRVLAAHPVVALRQQVETVAFVLLDPGGYGWRRYLSVAVLLAAALVGAWRWWREGERATLVAALLTVAYSLALSGGLQAYARFRVPLVPLLALLAGASLLHLSTPARRRHTSAGPC